ncbi:MAG: hypothetical protein P4K83_11500 [Terracidiphilus sp.]|nr:hypothetical protein [Terracidiphilus sp.]
MDTVIGRWMAMTLEPRWWNGGKDLQLCRFADDSDFYGLQDRAAQGAFFTGRRKMSRERRISGHEDLHIGIGTALLIMVTLESALMGSGRMLMVGSLTVKMWLFIVAQIYVIASIALHRKVGASSVAITLSFSMLSCLGVIVGLLHHSTIELILQDIQPAMYVFMLFFVEMTMRDIRNVHRVMTLIKAASIFVSITYFVIVSLLLAGIINFTSFYNLLSSATGQEFMFRGISGMFFYKGFIYIAIGLIYFAFDPTRKARIAAVITVLALIATGMRGFFLALMAVLIVHYMTCGQQSGRKIKYVVMPVACLSMVLIMFSGSLVGKEDSDYVRITTAREVMDKITLPSVLFGNGFGIGVESKPVHMESSFLEIFHKQGLLGCLWWGAVFALLVERYRKVRQVNYSIAQPLFLSVVFLIFESMTNPYLNNPIGMYVLIVAVAGLGVLARSDSLQPLLTKTQCASF